VTAAVCSRCAGLVRAAGDQVEVRVEYRSVTGLRRLRTWRVRVVCRACAMAEWQAHDRPGGRDDRQEELWP
jgi:hypothetical protein